MATTEKSIEGDQLGFAEDSGMTVDIDNSSSSDDSSSESEDSENEADKNVTPVDLDLLEKQITSLQTEIDANPFIYDKHTQLITALSSVGDAVRLKAARERMSSLFPLTEALWLDWFKDETDDVSRTELFQRAINDYASIKIWIEYIYHSMRGMSEPDGVENVRKIFENAVSVVGLDVANGTLVWEAYREFELVVLTGLQPPQGAAPSSDFEAQTKRITKLFKRQLSVPLNGMESTFDEYKAWIEGDVDEETQLCYDRALLLLAKFKPYEVALAQTDPPHLDAYNKYIELELSRGDLPRVQCIFERALQENCLIPNLWIRYTEFLEKNAQSDDVTLSVYRRSIRNCPWSVELWVGLLRTLEMVGTSHEQIRATFNEALFAGFTQGSEYLELWSAYIDFLRRRVDWNSEHTSQLDELRQAFERAISQLYASYPVDGDPKCSLTRSWAFIEAKFCRNMSKSRELWSQMMLSGYEGDAPMWLEYVQLERAFGDVKHCRRILQKALNLVQDWPEVICEAFLRFEREEGDLVHYRAAAHLCKEKLKQVEERRLEEIKRAEKLADQKKRAKREKKPVHQPPKQSSSWGEKSVELRPYQKSKKVQKQTPSAEEVSNLAGASGNQGAEPIVYVRGSQQKRKLEEMSFSDLPPPIPAEAALILDKEGFKIPPPPPLGELPKSPSSTNPPSGLPTKPGPSQRGNPPPGFIQKTLFSSDEPEKPETSSAEPPFKRMKENQSDSKCTVFVSNLNYTVSDDQIKQFFTKAGQVKEVRLVMNTKTHISRGFGYVEFIDELTAAEALKMDRKPIDGRPVYVSEYEPSETSRSKFRFEVGLEKKKLFVRGVPLAFTEEQLEAEFAKHGKLKAVRLATYKSGKSKGIAYVEYMNEDAASQAILKMDGQMLGDSTLSVAISNPPPRNAPTVERQSTFVPSLGGGKKDNRHLSAKTQLSMVPRSLQKNILATEKSKSDATNSEGTENGTETRPQMTNKDFRSMLLKK